MDQLTFISSVIASIAWPVVALVALFTLRVYLPAIGGMVRKVKYMDVEVEFGKAVTELEIDAQAFFPEIETPTLPRESEEIAQEEKLLSLAKISHRAAILEAWGTVETVARKAYLIIPRRWNHPWHLKTTEEEFVEQNVLTKQQSEVYKELKYLKYAVDSNKAGNIDEESVKKYIRSATAMAAHLDMFVKSHSDKQKTS